AQRVDSSMDVGLGRSQGLLQDLRDLLEAQALDVAKDQSSSVTLRQRGHESGDVHPLALLLVARVGPALRLVGGLPGGAAPVLPGAVERDEAQLLAAQTI